MAGAMGWSPADLAEASLWQLAAAFNGWREAQGGDKADSGLSDAEADLLADFVDASPRWVN